MITPINTINGITYFGYKSGPSPGIDITRSQLIEFLDTALGAANNEVLPNVMEFHARIPSRELITGAVTTTASDGKTRVLFDNNLRIVGVYPHNETTPGPFVPVQNPYVIPNLTGERVVYMCASNAGLGILQIRLNSGVPDQNGYVFNYIGYSTEAYNVNYPLDLHCIVSYKIGDSTDNGVFGITNNTSTTARTITPRPNVSCRENRAKPASDVVLDESIKAQPFLVWLDRPLAIGGVVYLISNSHGLYISCGRLGSGSILMRVIGQNIVYC
jgi:hypothetical protein